RWILPASAESRQRTSASYLRPHEDGGRLPASDQRFAPRHGHCHRGVAPIPASVSARCAACAPRTQAESTSTPLLCQVGGFGSFCGLLGATSCLAPGALAYGIRGVVDAVVATGASLSASSKAMPTLPKSSSDGSTG